MIEHWHWPQYVESGLLVLGVIVHVSNHGNDRDPYNGPAAAIGAAIVAWLLYMGGFWS